MKQDLGFDFPLLNQIINVQAYKHDGQLYRQWNGAKVVSLSNEEIILFLFKTKVKELKGQKWVVREPMLWWIPFEHFFNTTLLIREDGFYYYTNIASPPIFEDNTLKFIDYDLDIKIYPQIKTKLVDRKEFADNSKKLAYSDKLLKIIDQTIEDVFYLSNNNQAFFNKKTIDKLLKFLIENKYLTAKLYKEIKT